MTKHSKDSVCNFRFRVLGIVWLLFLVSWLFIGGPTVAHAAKGDYQDLVQRNLELREKYQALEKKYTDLENERNVLIAHIRTLQQEKERLLNPEEKAREAQVQEALEEMSQQLENLVQEKERLEMELARVEKMYEESQATAQTFEPQTEQSRGDAPADVETRRGASLQKDLAIERAFYQAKEEAWQAERTALLAEQDQLKADMAKLAPYNPERISTGLAETPPPVGNGLKPFPTLSGTVETRLGASLLRENKKLASKLAKAEKAQRKAEKKLEETEELRKELQSQRQLQKEQEAIIRQMSSEQSALEEKLARQAILSVRQADAAGREAGLVSAQKKNILSLAKKQRLDMHFNLAVAYDKTAMYKAEEREYLKCLKIDPNDANVHYNLAILYDDKLNNNAKAIRHYKKYLHLVPAGEDKDIEQVKHWLLYAEEHKRLGE